MVRKPVKIQTPLKQNPALDSQPLFKYWVKGTPKRTGTDCKIIVMINKLTFVTHSGTIKTVEQEIKQSLDINAD